jgi:hypothetical protein
LVATSAVTGHNISFLFVKIAEMIRDVSVERYKKARTGVIEPVPNSEKPGCC